MLDINNLHASVEGNNILNGLTLHVKPGEVHAVMGPNGSGKSTLANVLAGREGYTITDGSMSFDGQELAELDASQRAQAGIFLAFQYPVEIPGVSNIEFLKVATESIRKARGLEPVDSIALLKRARKTLQEVDLEPVFLKRGVNEDFSGGEKKRNEIMQMMMLEPKLAILDETDSGLDIDALKVAAAGVNAMRSPERSFILVTHYQRLLNFIEPDYVHVLVDGKIVKSGDKSLALKLEEQGYSWLTEPKGQTA